MTSSADVKKSPDTFKRFTKTFKKYRGLYLIILPVIIYYILFQYKPMYGLLIAFQNYRPRLGIAGSPWVGFEHFKTFFSSVFFASRLRNTLTISLSQLIFEFPAPIILALLINELRGKKFSKTVQTITYLPHFISLVVVCGMIRNFVSEAGFITQIIAFITRNDPYNLLNRASHFVPIYVLSEVWQGVGWGSIVYLAALTGINEELYEAAQIDGANRWKQVLNVTIPGIVPTIIVMFILRVGKVMGVGHEKIILLYNEGIYETADVISSFVYRVGLLNQQYSYSTAIGLMNSIVNFGLVILANTIVGKVSENNLW